MRYALPVLLLDLLGLAGSSDSFGEDSFFSALYSLKSFRAFTSFEQYRM
jgi:hypothetical protein